MPKHSLLFSWLLAFSGMAFAQPATPTPPPPVPTHRQLAWQSLELSAFVHFGVNTFTDREWGDGAELESLFAPTDFDAERIVRIFRDAGMRSVILTCKHHDGFCLWPSAYTDHSLRNSPWQNGRGDVVRDLSDACRKYGLKFGVYLSPWDRNHKEYGRPEYLRYFRAQLRELLTNYGPISEVWFDGANGGDGYYGGHRERRTIDPRSYYGWPETWELVRRLAPDAVIFSDVGPDVRWVGNEEGYAGETCWSTYSPVGVNGDQPAPGYTRFAEAVEGHRNGAQWLPAECDVSIRPGWFYHPSQDTLVRTPLGLLRLYLRSVGRNGALLLNVPPDRRGLIAAPDSAALIGFRRLRERCFARDLSAGATASATSTRNEDARFAAGNILDEDPATVWAASDPIRSTALTISFPASTRLDCVELSEDISSGQRVAAYHLERWTDGGWSTFASATTIGHKRILLFPPIVSDRMRIVIDDATAAPVIASLRVFLLPPDVHAALLPSN